MFLDKICTKIVVEMKPFLCRIGSWMKWCSSVATLLEDFEVVLCNCRGLRQRTLRTAHHVLLSSYTQLH